MYVLQMTVTNACLGFGNPAQFLQGGGAKTAIFGKIFDKILGLLFKNSRAENWVSDYMHTRFDGSQLNNNTETLSQIGIG